MTGGVIMRGFDHSLVRWALASVAALVILNFAFPAVLWLFAFVMPIVRAPLSSF